MECVTVELSSCSLGLEGGDDDHVQDEIFQLLRVTVGGGGGGLGRGL